MGVAAMLVMLQDHLNKYPFAGPKESHMKFEFNWPRGFREEDV